MKRLAALLAGLAALLTGLAPAPDALAQANAGYRLGTRTCDGYPRLPIGMADGMCAGLVYAVPGSARPAAAPVFPRTVMELPGGDVLVVAMGGWQAGIGSVWRFSGRPGRAVPPRRLLYGLAMPHQAAIGPDGRVYVGESTRIIRFDPDAPSPQATIETVLTGLPGSHRDDSRHPLSHFIFDADGSLILNAGAPTDQCDDPAPAPGRRCGEGTGPQASAALWRYAYLGNGRWAQTPTLLASGLRNSMGLVRHASGTILQAENSIDLPEDLSPFDEINRIEPGRHYGWPYCIEIRRPAPAWRAARAMDCAGAAHTPPVMLLPPHGAPLSMLYYDGPMFPQLRGRLIVGLHGYRPAGARIMAYEVDVRGVPLTAAGATYAIYRGANAVRRPFPERGQTGLNLTPNWNDVTGQRPMGAPVGLMVARDGAIWVADDRNGAILRLAADRP